MRADAAPDSVVQAYGAWYGEFHGRDTVEVPDLVKVGATPAGDVWRAADGWGESYFLDPPTGEATWVATKMPDVMAYDVAGKFHGKIDGKRARELGMSDAAWDSAVLSLFEETT